MPKDIYPQTTPSPKEAEFAARGQNQKRSHQKVT